MSRFLTLRRPTRTELAVAAMALLLGVLAVLQYDWVGKLSSDERERLRRHLDRQADEFTEDFNRELTRIYFRLADDRLQGRLPEQVSETYLRERYDLTRVQLTTLLGRICQEGWAERRPGYGWVFSEMLTTPEALLQTYRLRMALEPAAMSRKS